MVLLSGRLGVAIISPQMKTRHCKADARIYTSKVPFTAFFMGVYFTLGAMRIMQIFYVSQVVVFAAGFVACSVLVASSFVAELLLFPVRLFSRSVSFGVSRSSLLRSLFRLASPVFSCGSLSPFCRQRSVAELASNFTLKRDAAEARRPLAPR